MIGAKHGVIFLKLGKYYSLDCDVRAKNKSERPDVPIVTQTQPET